MLHAKDSIPLESILIFTHEKMHQLYQLLINESEILKNNNIEELEDITLKKTSLTEQIEKSEIQRINFLSEKSLNPNEPAQWLQNNKLISVWEKMKNISEKAKKQNQINGQVIYGNRRRTQAKIEILSISGSTPSAELVYSPSGENIKQHTSKTLAHV